MMGILLDTCVIIYMVQYPEKLAHAHSAVSEAESDGQLWVSPVSAWEIGRLAALGKLAMSVNPLIFFNTFVSESGARLTDLGADILIASSFLPGNPHKDPMDRVLMATAREMNISLLTDDRAILAYSEEGHVKTLAC